MISGQFETKSDVQYCQPIRDSYSKSVQLCSECNVRQEIKIKLLAEFIPFNENNFSQECDEYNKYLEKEYKLCSYCETTVQNVLSQPINSNRDAIKTSIRSEVDPNIDSVFVGQNSRRNANLFSFLVINVLENISLFCALIVFVFGLNQLQSQTKLSIIEFPENLIQYLESRVSDQTIVLYSGFMASMTGVLISGKKCLLMTNIFCQLLWISIISLKTVLMTTYIDEIDSILLYPILSLFVVFFSAINTSLRLFGFFNSKSKIKQKSNKSEEQSNSFQNSKNNKLSVCSSEKHVNSFNEIGIKSNKTTDQSIGEQIKSLTILDKTDSTLNCRQTQHYFKTRNIFSNNYLNSSLMSENCSVDSYGKSIILPAKFHYESVAQTSWASPFKPNTSPRKDKFNSIPYFTSNQSFARTSHWVSHQMSGLVTPPPSATASVCSKFFLFFVTFNGFNLSKVNQFVIKHN